MATKFLLRNPERYVGNINKVMYSDSKMFHLFNLCDRSSIVSKWSNEQFAVHFLNPKTKDMDTFYPDLMLTYKHKGNMVTEVLDARSIETKKSLHDPVNIAKWEAAKKLCEKNGIVFKVLHNATKYKLPY